MQADDRRRRQRQQREQRVKKHLAHNLHRRVIRARPLHDEAVGREDAGPAERYDVAQRIELQHEMPVADDEENPREAEDAAQREGARELLVFRKEMRRDSRDERRRAADERDVRGRAVGERRILAEEVKRHAEQTRRGETQLLAQPRARQRPRAERDEKRVSDGDAVKQNLPRLKPAQQILRRHEGDAPNKSNRRRQPVAEQPPAPPKLQTAAPLRRKAEIFIIIQRGAGRCCGRN